MSDPHRPDSVPPQKVTSPADADWCVCRIDDNGNRFVVRDDLAQAEAERLVAEFEARGHKQVYWAARRQGNK